jgi:hypothetical protein
MTCPRFLVESPSCGGITEIVGPGTTGLSTDPMLRRPLPRCIATEGSDSGIEVTLCVAGHCCFLSPGALPLSVWAFRTLPAHMQGAARARVRMHPPPSHTVPRARATTGSLRSRDPKKRASLGAVRRWSCCMVHASAATSGICRDRDDTLFFVRPRPSSKTWRN